MARRAALLLSAAGLRVHHSSTWNSPATICIPAAFAASLQSASGSCGLKDQWNQFNCLHSLHRPAKDDTPHIKDDSTNTPHASATPVLHPNADAESPWNTPNMLSLARGASGPFIAYMIVQEQWPAACTAVIISGATDWLDGYLARRMGLHSVLGSYLDPLGDKLLICSVVSALAIKGLIPMWVVMVVVGRDVGLVAGIVLHRWHSLGWRMVPIQEFLRTRPTAGPTAMSAGALPAEFDVAGHSKDAGGVSDKVSDAGKTSSDPANSSGGAATATARSTAPVGVPVMRPLFISKVNTVLQLGLVSACMSHAWVAWPDAQSLHLLELTTAATTGASCLAYASKYFSGKLL